MDTGGQSQLVLVVEVEVVLVVEVEVVLVDVGVVLRHEHALEIREGLHVVGM